MKKALLAPALAMVMVSGCMTYDPYTGEEEVSNATSGAIIGALSGAAAGALINHGDRGEGALIGAATGAAAGGGIGYYMDRQEAELRHKLQGTGVQVERVGDQINLIMPGDITFAVDQATIRDRFVEVLESVALILQEFDETAIRIEGHTDSTGSASYNQKLSERRAMAVRDVLLRQGIDISRTSVAGYGETRPVASNDTEAGRQANRRVTLSLIPLAQ